MGSARISRVGLASYRNNLSIGGAGSGREMLKEKFATARTRSPFTLPERVREQRRRALGQAVMRARSRLQPLRAPLRDIRRRC